MLNMHQTTYHYLTHSNVQFILLNSFHESILVTIHIQYGLILIRIFYHIIVVPIKNSIFRLLGNNIKYD